MLLVIDVGNTNMVLGIFEGAELKGSFRLMTDANRTSDEVGLLMCQYFQRFGVALDQVEDVVIGSVVPQVMHTLSNAVRKYLGKVPLVIDEDLDPRLPYIPCDSDERLGPDRAVADIAAIEKYGAPLIVLDFGTATTLDAVSADGVYLGGCITAGVRVSIDGLFQKNRPAAPGGTGEAGYCAEHHRSGPDSGGGGHGLYWRHGVSDPSGQGRNGRGRGQGDRYRRFGPHGGG